MHIKRGTLVEFIGKEAQFYKNKYGVQLGDKGKVVSAKRGWVRITWTLQNNLKAVSVPMRLNHFIVNPVLYTDKAPDTCQDHDKNILVKTEQEIDSQHITTIKPEFKSNQEPSKGHIACAQMLKISREQNKLLKEQIYKLKDENNNHIIEYDRLYQILKSEITKTVEYAHFTEGHPSTLSERTEIVMQQLKSKMAMPHQEPKIKDSPALYTDFWGV